MTIDVIEKTSAIIYKTTKKKSSMKYRFLRVLGEGVNGPVCLIEEQEDFKVYAMKRYAKEDDYCEFEIEALKLLFATISTPYVIKMIDIIRTTSFVYILLEPMDTTLKSYITKNKMQDRQIESTFIQLLRALKHCHELNVYHRDVKPENVLINANGDVKLCDFSLSRKILTRQNLTDYVVTLWYRAPELFLGCTWYNSSIDVWAACCVLIEMIYGKPPFYPQENTEICQLKTIFSRIGKPTQDELSKIAKLDVNMDNLDAPTDTFSSTIPFVNRTFVYDFENRPTCADILNELSTTITNMDEKIPFNIQVSNRVELNSTRPPDWTEVFYTVF
tara:strand:- start:6447 stop:7442 length:996 start_codon:yes stop_codon:yes gene_type:complete